MNARNRTGFALALIWLGLLAAASVAAPLFLGEAAAEMDFRAALEAPSRTHPFGTDALGRDVFARTLCGAGVSLAAGFGAVLVATLVGMAAGAFAGYYGGWRDRLVSAVIDVMLCFPVFFLILAVIAILGPGLGNIILVIGLTGWMGTARLVRAEMLTLKEREYVLAAKALGAGDARVVFSHLLPNAAAPVIAHAVLGVSSAVLLESGLSFLGIGVQPPTPSWGNMLMDGKAALGAAWWLTVYPGTMILLTVLAVNVVGERLHGKVAVETSSAP
jgi:peptide/nickel transport system permease protein